MVLLLDWQGFEQYSVHEAEKRRTHPDTEGKHKHSNKKESWMSDDYSGGLRTFPRKFRDRIFHSASHQLPCFSTSVEQLRANTRRFSPVVADASPHPFANSH